MIRGLYTSASGMMAQYEKMDTISNNLANVDTVGYKKDQVITASFEEELVKRINDRQGQVPVSRPKNIGTMSLGVKVDEIFTNFTQGSLQETNQELDLALHGVGFFTVLAQEGGEERYTRNGAFLLDPSRRLVTATGERVMGQQGPITLPVGDVTIKDTGEIFVNGVFIDRLQIQSFDDSRTLRKIGDNLLAATEQSQPRAFGGTVRQGFLESSNVNPVREMVEMITVMRTYEASQKALQAQDQTLEKLINEVSRV